MNEGRGEVRIVASLAVLSRQAAEVVTAAARDAVQRRGSFALAVSGGSTPAGMFALLATPEFAGALPWPQTQLYWADERCVPPESPQSNYALAQQTLLSRLPAPPAAVHRIHGEGPDPEQAALAYEQTLPEAFDLLVLGIGPEGHTASLFPGEIALHEHERRVVSVVAPTEPARRITITPPVIAAARQIMVLAVGAGKASAVARALLGEWDPDEIPAQLARRGIWLLDAAAGAEIADTLGRRCA